MFGNWSGPSVRLGARPHNPKRRTSAVRPRLARRSPYAPQASRLLFEQLEERTLLSVAPDMTVVSASLGLGAAVAGNDFKLPVTWTVENQGSWAPTQNWSDSFYLSSTPTYDGSAQYIAEVARHDPLPLAVGADYTSSTTLTIPNTALQGSQYLLVVADADNSLGETNTFNNTYALAITLSQPNVALTVSDASVSSTDLVAGGGATVSVSWTVTNAGTDTAQTTWSDGIYLSSNTTYDVSAVLLGEFDAPRTLAAGASYTQTQTVTVPNTTLLGSNLYILIVANHLGRQGGNSMAGGTAAVGNVSVSAAQDVDLELAAGSVTAPASATLGQRVDVSWTVSNIGSAAAGAAWTDSVYASPTADYDAATATPLGSFPAPMTLTAGASYVQTQSVFLPGDAAGDSFILVRTNANGDQAESDVANDTNNAASAAISLSEPSLAINAFTAPAEAIVGDAVALSWSVENTSSVATVASWSDAVYISDNPVFDSTAQRLASFPAPLAGSLAAGTSYAQTAQFLLPATQTGNRYLFLVADADGAQPVSNSMPIVASSPITLAEPELTVALDAPTSAVLGQAFNLSWTVTNTGSVAARASWEDAIFISSSPNFDPATATPLPLRVFGYTYEGTAQDEYGIPAPCSLGAGDSYTRAGSLVLPSMPSGDYYLFVVADRLNEQGTTSESVANVAVQPIGVTGPDLIVQIDSAPSAAVAGNGQSITVSWTVTNTSTNSTDSAVAWWHDTLYLSRTATLDLNDASTYWKLGYPTYANIPGFLRAGESYRNSQTVTVPNVQTAETYYLLVVTNTDSNGNAGPQSETDTTNDIASAAIDITVPAGVAFAVQDFSATPNAFVAGSSVSLSWTVRNQGTEAARGIWTDTVYLSSNPTLDSLATSIGSMGHYGPSSPVAGNGGSYRDTVSVTIPAQTPAGPMYLLVVPDSDGGQFATTSAFSQPMTVTLPDVKLATAITSAPTTAAVGQSLSLSWTVTNYGTATTSVYSWKDGVYLSQSPTYDTSAVLLSTYNPYTWGSPAALPLSSGKSYAVTQQIWLPATLPAGDYFLLVRADCPDYYYYQAQLDASQNIASAAITVTGGGGGGVISNVDLTVSAATAPPTCALGGTVFVSYTVTNQGTDATSQSWFDKVYLSNSPVLDSHYATQVIDTFSNQSALSGGASYTATVDLDLSSYWGFTSLGTCYLVFVANSRADQAEVNTSNNSFAVPITVTGPRLAVTAASFTGSTIEPNMTGQISWTVQNQGDGPAKGYWYDYLYLSPTPVFDESTALDIDYAYLSYPSGLAVNGTYSQTMSVDLYNWTLGDSYLLVVVDTWGYVEEPGLSVANVFAIPITVNAPNLAVSNVSVTPNTVEAGNNAKLNLSWTVTNTSPYNASGSWDDAVYLSPTPVFHSDTATLLKQTPGQAPLAAGASYHASVNNVVVPNVAPGTYYVFFAANMDYVVNNNYDPHQPESNPADNLLAAAAPITLTAPNVTMQAGSVSVGNATLAVGQQTTVSFKVTNAGGEAANASWSDAVYLCTSPTFDGIGRLVSLSRKNALSAGAYYTQSATITIPSNQALGTYYLFCVANDGRGQGESDYSGDVSAPIPITVGAPDLSMQVTTAPTSAKCNDTVSVSWTVTNVSSEFAASANWQDIVYLSDSPALNVSTALQVGYVYSYYSYTPLAAGANYTRTANITIPNTSTGEKYLFFVADANSNLTQTTRANDVAMVPITLAAPEVDLQILSVTAPATVNVGDYASVSWTVQNAGTDPAKGPWADKVYLSSKNTFDSSATLYYTVSPPSTPLAAGASYQQTYSWLYFSTYFTPGTYYLFVVTNGTNGQSETNSTNNISPATQIIVTARLPDLQVTNVSAPATGVDGSTISLTWTVKNMGVLATSGYWHDSVYASSDTTFDASDQYLANFYESYNLAANGGQYTDTKTVSLSGCSLTGPAYLIVITNYYNSLLESNSNNNSGASAQITLAAPALSLSDVTAPAVGIAGASIPISWKVTNTSSVSAETQWYDYIFISSHDYYDSSAQYVGSFAAPTTPLAAQGSYTQSRNVTLPGTCLGSVYLLFVVDRGNVQPQTNAANNCVAVPIEVSAADLTVSLVTAPTSVSLGQPESVSWTVTNNGTSPATRSWYDGVYYSASSTFNGSAVFLKSVPVGGDSPLAVGANYTHSAEVTLPSGLAPGSYYFLVKSDAYDYQPETNENNNTAASDLVVVTGANLTVSSVTAPLNAVLDEPVSVSWTVTNGGSSPATRSWRDSIYYSTKNTYDSSAVWLANVDGHGPLGSGDHYSVSAVVTLPSGVAAGDGYFLVCANSDRQQAETSLNDNTAASDAVAVTGADLTVPAAGSEATATYGQSVTVHWTVLNTGAQPTSHSWTDGIYISAKNTFDSTARWLADVPVGGSHLPLAAGASYDQSASVVLPTPTAQSTNHDTCYLYVVANNHKSQPVTDEHNNVSAAWEIVLTLPPLPDLIVENVSTPATAFNNTQVLISWTELNQGTAAAVGPWTDSIYYSTSSDGSNPTWLGRFTYPGSLAINASTVTLTQAITLPATLGDLWIVVATDTDQGAMEGPNSLNNAAVAAEPIHVTQQPLPDLVVTSITPPASGVMSGTLVPISFVITNQGTAPTSAPVWQDWVILSQDPTLAQSYQPDLGGNNDQILNNQPVLTGFDNASYLGVGQSYTQTVNVPLPVGAQGTWYVYVVAGGTGLHHPFTMLELTRDNNLTLSGAFTIALSPSADLSVVGVQTPLQAFSGQPMNISWTVQNIGTGPTAKADWPDLSGGKGGANWRPTSNAATVWVDTVYMSTKSTLDSTATLLGTFIHYGALGPDGAYTNSRLVTLPVGVSGNYYFLVKTDFDGDVFENGLTSDNVNPTVSAVTVFLSPPPVLVTSITAAPTTVLASHPLTFTYEVANAGAGPTMSIYGASGWQDACYLSPTPTFDASTAISLGSKYHAGTLAPGANYSQPVTVTVPDGLSGDYYVLVQADSYNAVFALDHTCELGTSGPIRILSEPADLAVTALGAPPSVLTGQALQVSWTVTNQGSGDTAITRWNDEVYADTSSQLSTNRVLLGSFEHGGLLNPGGSYSTSAFVALPARLSGLYNLFVVTNVKAESQWSAVYEAGATANNVSAPLPIAISQQLADLQVRSVTAPTATTSGSAMTVIWTIQNIGTGPTSSSYWYDDVWLSTDSAAGSGGTDLYLGTVQHTNPLAPGGSYSAMATFTLPETLPVGNYHVIVAADRPVALTGTNYGFSLVYESDENNNQASAASQTAVTLRDVPDLAVSEITVPASAYSGRGLALGWTVTNNGAATGEVRIPDSVYLSLNQVLDSSARYLGTVITTTDGLAAGESYTASAFLPIPTGMAGTYYVFVVTGTNAIYERNTANNVAYQPTPVQVQIPPPCDLVAGTILIPANAVPGQTMTIQYQVTNVGSSQAEGTWWDSLYLSPDETWSLSDPLLGRVQQTRTLMPGGGAGSTYHGALTAYMPGVDPGQYYVIVRTNILNSIPETTLSNNLSASLDQTMIDVPELVLGTPASGELLQGQSVYYKVTVDADQTLRVTLEDSAASDSNELYVSFGTMPTRGRYDYRYSQPLQAGQQITIPITRAGTYYILACAQSVAHVPEAYTLTAALIPFAVTAVEPGTVSNAGTSTLMVEGGKFDRATTFQLIGPGGEVIPSLAVMVQDLVTAYVTFDLEGAALGSYRVAAISAAGAHVELPGGLQVVSGQGGVLVTGLSGPASVLPGQVAVATETFGNSGDADIGAPLIFMDSATGNRVSLTYPFTPAPAFLAISPTGPAGTLRPGTQFSREVYFQASTTIGDTNNVEDFVVGADCSTPLDWSQIEGTAFVEAWWTGWTASPNWPAAYALLKQHAGPTWGTFVQLLDKNATLLPADALDPSNVANLLKVEVTHDLAAVNTSISGGLLAADLAIPISNVHLTAVNTTTGDVFGADTYTDGSFVFETVTAGVYKFIVQGAVVDVIDPVNVADGQAVVGATIPLVRGARLSGLVTAAGSSTAIAGATVEAFAGDMTRYTTVTDSLGQYLISGLPADTYELVVTAAGEAQVNLPGVVVASVDVSQDIAMHTEGRISGTILPPAGGPASPQFVIVGELAGSTDVTQSFTTQSPVASFTLSGLPAGTYTITITSSGFVTQTFDNVVVAEGQTTSLGNFTLIVGASVSGTFTSDDPQLPAAGATIGAYQGTTLVTHVTADDGGNFLFSELAPGTYTFQLATSAGYYSSVSETLAAGQQLTGVLLSFQPGATIAGRVMETTSGLPLVDVPVTLAIPGGGTSTTVTDAEGDYQFTGLNVGNYAVSLEIPEDGGYAALEVTSLTASYTVNLQSVFPQSISGRLLDAQGNPIADGAVQFLEAGHVILTTMTDSDGSYKVVVKQAGTYDLIGLAPGASFAPVVGVVVASGQAVVQDIHAGHNTLQVTVQGSGSPSDANDVCIQLLAEGRYVAVGYQSQAGDGTVSFADLAPGTYRVVVRGANHLGTTVPVTVVDGSPAAVIAPLASLATVAGLITDSSGNPLEGASVTLTDPIDPTFAASTASASDGTYTLDFVPNGTYDLTVVLDGYAASVVSGVCIAASGEVQQSVTLVLSTSTLSGKVLDASGNPLILASVQVTDVLGRVLGFASVGSDGSFELTSAVGCGLTLTATADGYRPQLVTGINVSVGATVDLGAIAPHALADDDWVAEVQALIRRLFMLPLTYVSNPWYRKVGGDITEVQDALNAMDNEVFPPPPACPVDRAAWQAVLYAQDVLLQRLFQAQEAVDVCKQKRETYGGMWANDYANDGLLAAGLINGLITFGAWATGASLVPALVPVAVTTNLISALKGTVEAVCAFQNDLRAASTSVNSRSSQHDFQDAGMFAIRQLRNELPALMNCLAIVARMAGEAASMALYKGFFDTVNNALTIAQKGFNKCDFLPLSTAAAGPLEDAHEDMLAAFRLYLMAEANYEKAKNAYHPRTPPCPPDPPHDNQQQRNRIDPSTQSPHDPNNIIGPAGFGEANYVRVDAVLPYRINFENEPNAGLPAQQVTVTQQIDSHLNWQSFRLGSFGFGGAVYQVPANTAFCQTRIDLTATKGYYVDVVATIDVRSGTAIWIFTTIDPATGQIPLDPTVGFLPPEDSAGIGQGFVSYTIVPLATAQTGDVIEAQATIIFYTQPPLDTEKIFNTIDAGTALTSAVAPLTPYQTAPQFDVSWSGTDDAAGSAISTYAIYVAVDDDPYAIWLSNTTVTSAAYLGADGHRYSFYSVAANNAGNVQAAPPAAQASTLVDLSAPTSGVIALPPRETSLTFQVSWWGSDGVNGSGIGAYDLWVSDDGGEFQPWLTGTTSTSADFAGQNGHTYAFYSIATDNVGHKEAKSAVAEATTTVQHQVATTTLLSTDHPDGSTYGQAVTFTATVIAHLGEDIPTGFVQFVVDGMGFGSLVALVNGAASLTVSSLAAGTHTIDAVYTSDDPASFENSQTETSLAVSVERATLTITADDQTMVYGAALPTLTATYVGLVNQETAADLDVCPTLETEATSTSSPGAYAISASGATDANYTISYVGGTLNIAKASVTAALSSSIPDVSVYGQSVTFTVVVSAVDPSLATPTGMVLFKNGAGALGLVALENGVARFTTSSVLLSRGAHAISAVYQGDSNWNAGATASLIQTVQTATLEPDLLVPGKYTLAVGGTSNDDVLYVSYSSSTGQVVVLVSGGTSYRANFNVADLTHIVLYGAAGRDLMRANASVPLPVLMFGGDGNDALWGGSAGSVLVGGKGNDSLHGGSGRDVLIGGLGSDNLDGQGDQDVLIGGTTDHDANLAALELVLAEWKRTDAAFSVRYRHLLGPGYKGLAGGMNGTAYLNPMTVHDDATVDYLLGGAGTDWYFGTSGTVRDLMAARTLGEMVTYYS